MRDHMLEELEAKVADGVGVFGRAEPARHQDTQRVAVFDLLAERVRRAAPRLRFARVVQNLECLYRLLHLQLSLSVAATQPQSRAQAQGRPECIGSALRPPGPGPA